jgi:hypothetical protein
MAAVLAGLAEETGVGVGLTLFLAWAHPGAIPTKAKMIKRARVFFFMV